VESLSNRAKNIVRIVLKNLKGVFKKMVDYVYKKVDCKKSKREQYEKRSGHEAVTISGDTTIYISGDLAKAYGLQVNDRVDLYRLEKQGNDTNIFCFVKADKGDIKIRQKNKNGMATPKLTANTKDGVAYIREVTESRKFRAWIS
jgi:hypothetical protein